MRDFKVYTLHFPKSPAQSDNKLCTQNLRETSLTIQSWKSRKGVWQDSRILSGLQNSLLPPEMVEFMKKIGGKNFKYFKSTMQEEEKRREEKERGLEWSIS